MIEPSYESDEDTPPTFNLKEQEHFIEVADSLPWEAFPSLFEENYGKFHPNFFVGKCKDAANAAKEKCYPLLVYLHKEGDEAADLFCRYVLAHFQVEFERDFFLPFTCSPQLKISSCFHSFIIKISIKQFQYINN
jgi:hypothetical protein